MRKQYPSALQYRRPPVLLYIYLYAITHVAYTENTRGIGASNLAFAGINVVKAKTNQIPMIRFAAFVDRIADIVGRLNGLENTKKVHRRGLRGSWAHQRNATSMHNTNLGYLDEEPILHSGHAGLARCKFESLEASNLSSIGIKSALRQVFEPARLTVLSKS